MWKVTNEKNVPILKAFETKVIYSFFKLLLNASEMKENNIYIVKSDEEIWKITGYYKGLPAKSQKIIDYYFKRSREKIYFYSVFKEIVDKYSKKG
ncbi:hypothetical protein [Bacillus cereus]|uniref:hypothetical protein n=1 Tax=Bacillus cereus TaxID=1396 RepID=UPI000BF2822A|nr:hypothetical protein [Bacillus cereus]PFR51033.1 hypothetical protein COK35_07655 [Bacillus cereus]